MTNKNPTTPDCGAIDRDMSAWAESDAAISAVENNTSPRHTAQSHLALEAFRRAGRPRLDAERGGKGSSPRRQVRLPAELNAALDSYAVKNNLNPSEVIRDALNQYLSNTHPVH